MLRRLTLTFFVAAAFATFVSARYLLDDLVFEQINTIVKSLSDISGMKELKPVAYGSMSKRRLRHFLAKRIKKTLKPEEIAADELTLKLFGLVPSDFNLKQSTIDLLTEQAAAFYDYDQKKLFLLEGASVPDETTTLAHELAHALADQHFDLGRFMDETPSNDDENLAHSAVVEGQASWLMLAYNLKLAGRSPEPTPEILRSLNDSNDNASTDYPVLKASPLYIRQSLIFPYTEGTQFFDAVYNRLGKAAFAAVFSNPPASSSQIFHPDRYFGRVAPQSPQLAKLKVDQAAKELAEGSVGEFDHKMLLSQYVGQEKAGQLAPHLKGASFRVSAEAKGTEPILQYSSDWDSEDEAADYFAAYKRVLTGKWRRCDPSMDALDLYAGTSESGYFVTRLHGVHLTSIEGLKSAEDWKAVLLQGESPASAIAKLN